MLQKVKELSKELEEARNELMYKTSVEVNDKVKTEPRDSVKLVENEEQISGVEYEKIVKELEETTREKEILENRFLECTTEVEKLRIDLEERREEARKKTEVKKIYRFSIITKRNINFSFVKNLRTPCFDFRSWKFFRRSSLQRMSNCSKRLKNCEKHPRRWAV